MRAVVALLLLAVIFVTVKGALKRKDPVAAPAGGLYTRPGRPS